MMSYLAKIVEVGGNEGSAFNFNGTENGTMLKKITVWVGKKKVKAIKVQLTDDQSEQFGVLDGKVSEFTFEDGENFTSLSLWENGDGTRLGGIKFKTNHSREFSASMSILNSKSVVPVDVASGICMGIKGRAEMSKSPGISSLGFMFINTIKSAELTNVEYPTLHDVIPKVAVREIKSMTYQNNTTKTQEYRIEASKKITQTSSWSVTGRLEFMVSLEVKAGIPLIANGTARYELKKGVVGTYASETTEEKMKLFLFPVKVRPDTSVDVDITIGQATVDLPFNGIVKITCHNNSVLQFKTSGTYKGVTYTDGKVAVNESAKKLDGASQALN
ncbi:aerolysin-like protein [Pangasianodon hypophthalmus]|uniref:aerolysin-like protein n=1 Tax=Pangasianodon hypophthalmus TaxID=310915 RepID=UPI00147B7616|nr:aerolysin-like protein [Pangasianodon hypophthalmus]